MAYPKFVSGTDELQFSRGIRYPVAKPMEKIQATDRSAAGHLEVEDLGSANIRTRRIAFKNLPPADYAALVNWFDNVANGAVNQFTYYDEVGDAVTVRIMNPVLDFQLVSTGGYSGELLLEVQS